MHLEYGFMVESEKRIAPLSQFETCHLSNFNTKITEVNLSAYSSPLSTLPLVSRTKLNLITSTLSIFTTQNAIGLRSHGMLGIVLVTMTDRESICQPESANVFTSVTRHFDQ